MAVGFTGVFAATFLLLVVACSGSDDGALAECVSVLADVTRDHYHFSGSTDSNASRNTGGVLMPNQWAVDNGQPWSVFGGSSPDILIDEKCAPFLSASRAAAVGSQQTPELIEYPTSAP